MNIHAALFLLFLLPHSALTAPKGKGKANTTIQPSSTTQKERTSAAFQPTSPAPKGKKTGVTFDQALPEDISNENFPKKITSFDFPNVTLLELTNAISKFTGINFIIDPSIQGKKISIIAPSPITVAEAYKAFLSALASNDYTIVKSGAFWKIQSIQKAGKDNIEVYSGDYFPNTDQLITRIISLKYIQAQEFSKFIKIFLSEKTQISADEASNSIVLSDYGSVIERVMKIVHNMDVPGSEEKIHIIPVEHASAENIATMLGDILSLKTKPRGASSISRSRRKPHVSLSISAKKSTTAGNLKISNIIPDPRTNSLVVLANKEGIKRIKELVKKLDAPVDASRMGGVYVYNVLYGTAEEVYNTLMGIKPSESDKQNSSQRGWTFPRHRYSPPRSSRSAASSSESPLFQNVTIMADSNTNSLIISAKNKYDYERVLSVLKKIDVPRDQVFIQAIIVEMIIGKDDHKDFKIGGTLGLFLNQLLKDKEGRFYDVLGSVMVGFLGQPLDPSMFTKPSSFGPGFVAGLPIAKLMELLGGGSPSENLTSTPRFSNRESEDRYAYSKAIEDARLKRLSQLSMIPLVKLLKTTTNVNVLSTPQLTTLDNVPAHIEVGEKAPVGLTTTQSIGGAQTTSTNREEVTLKLDITPRINPESGTVQMDIEQKFDDFAPESPSASELAKVSIRTIKRNIKTKMVLNDGETAVLGGLLTDKEFVNENKVPLLGDLPLIGWLFKGSTKQIEKRNLLVFIRPTIIKGEEQQKKTREILGKKLKERIHFIKKYMKGKDHHGEILQNLIPESQSLLNKTQEKTAPSTSDTVPPQKKDWKDWSRYQELDTNKPIEPPSQEAIEYLDEDAMIQNPPHEFHQDNTPSPNPDEPLPLEPSQENTEHLNENTIPQDSPNELLQGDPSPHLDESLLLESPPQNSINHWDEIESP